MTISAPGQRVLREELDWNLVGSEKQIEEQLWNYLVAPATGVASVVDSLEVRNRFRYFDYRDIGAPIASGSVRTEGMVIIPCTMGTVSGIACGASSDLIERAADVILKERRTLIVVPRETPLNAIHLRNLLTLAELGVHVVPAMPGFYHRPQEIQELVDFIVSRVLDLLDLENQLFLRWGTQERTEEK